MLQNKLILPAVLELLHIKTMLVVILIFKK